MGPSLEIETNKQKKIEKKKENLRKCENETSGMGGKRGRGGGEVSPTFDQIDGESKG